MQQRYICKRPAFLSFSICLCEEIQLSWQRSISPAFPGSEAGKFESPERRGSTRPLPVMALFLYSGRKMRSCYPGPDWDIWRAAVLLHQQTASPKVNQTFCFKTHLPFLWWKRQEILFQGSGGRHRDAYHVIRAILQPIWTKQDADCSGTLEKMGVAGTLFSRKNKKPPVLRGRGWKEADWSSEQPPVKADSARSRSIRWGF